MNILLLGGDGFLGKGLRKELLQRNVNFESLDKNDIDLSDTLNIDKLVKQLQYFDDIVVLASKIGAKLFETNAKDAAQYNKTIHENILAAVKLAAKKYNKSFEITYYSTSEVFNSQLDANTFITEDTSYSFDYSNPRHLYSYYKWQAELDYFNLKNNHSDIVSCVKILRPFNIFGRNQIRGVVYDMIESAYKTNKIYFSDDTTRTLTDIDFASKMSVDAILSHSDMRLNIVDNRNSLTMEALAHIIADAIDIKCDFIKMEADKSIRYRNTSAVNENLQMSKDIMTPHIIELAEQIKRNIV